MIGLSIGLFIGLVEEVAKEAWLKIIAGPLKGKQFILYEHRTVIGSNPACDIPLMKDPRIAPEHAMIEKGPSAYLLYNISGPGQTLVNGHPVARHTLQDGEVITIASTQIEFRERPESKKPYNGYGSAGM